MYDYGKSVYALLVVTFVIIAIGFLVLRPQPSTERLTECRVICGEYGLVPMIVRSDTCVCGNNGVIRRNLITP